MRSSLSEQKLTPHFYRGDPEPENVRRAREGRTRANDRLNAAVRARVAAEERLAAAAGMGFGAYRRAQAELAEAQVEANNAQAEWFALDDIIMEWEGLEVPTFAR